MFFSFFLYYSYLSVKLLWAVRHCMFDANNDVTKQLFSLLLLNF